MSTHRTRNSEPEDSNSSSRVAQVGHAVVSTFHALNDAEPHYVPGAAYSTVRHTRPWVYYQGTATLVPITVLGSAPLPTGRTFALQRRGWRTGLLGWSLGAWLGGTAGKWGTFDAKRRTQYDREVHAFLGSAGAPKDHRARETALVHVPAAVGDGYFRLLVKSPKGQVLATTASFRVGSLSLSSAHPRGASAATFVPELALKSAAVTAYTAAWASFYAAFPFLKAVQMLPGTHTWGTWALNRAYRLAGGEQTAAELKARYRVEERRAHAEEGVYRTVPFGAVGVRTAYDLEQDAKMGKGGVYFSREEE
ncbi:hypothetical protein FB451DRAFT_1448576 [Mycena latifolia]|nr:hypothetical protein FB451DRAFT_1448576 [Mycena latifolia]